jgi:hypothetical protein
VKFCWIEIKLLSVFPVGTGPQEDFMAAQSGNFSNWGNNQAAL